MGTGTFWSMEVCSTHAAFVEKAKDIRRAACLLYVTGIPIRGWAQGPYQ